MKLAFTILISGLICTSMHAAEDLSDTLRRGLFEEEANQNFDAAIQAYRGLIASHDNDRKLAATATYRLGECYRKLGRTNEAIAQYERVLQTFGDQPTLVTVCRQNLAGLGAASAVPGGTSRSASSTVGRESLTALQAESAALAALEQRLEAMSRPELRRAMPTAYPDALLARLLEQLSVMETKLAALTNQFALEHPDVQSILSQEKTLNREIEERLDGILAGLKLKSESMQTQIELLKAAAVGGATGIGATAGTGLDDGSRARVKELLNEELQLAEELFKEQAKSVANGRAPAGAETQFERDVLGVRRQLLAVDGLTTEKDRREWRALLEKEIQLAEAAVKYEKKLSDAGRALPREVARLQRDLVSLKRELVEFDASRVATSAPSATVERPAGTSEEDNEIRRIQSITKNSPDLVNAANVQVGMHRDAAIMGMPLHKAAQLGQLVVARYLLDHGAEVNARDGFARTPLSWAAGNGHKAMVELLLSRGADADAAIAGGAPGYGMIGFTPLHFAAQAGYRNVCEALLNGKATVNARSAIGETALHLVASRGFQAIAELLIARGADVNAPTTAGFTPLHLAVSARIGVQPMIELLLSKGAQIDRQTKSGATALYIAAQAGRLEIVHLFLAKKANPNLAVRSADATVTPLSATVLNLPPANQTAPRVAPESLIPSGTPTEIIDELLNQNADPNVTLDGNQDTPLHIAAARGHPNVVKLLLQHGANVNAQASDGNTPLISCIASNPTNLLQVVDALLEAKADVNVAARGGRTALFFAAAATQKDVVQRLIEAGADVNSLTTDGESPLSVIKPRMSRNPPFGAVGVAGSPFPLPPPSFNPVGRAVGVSQPDTASSEQARLLETINLLEQRGARDDLRRLYVISTSRNLGTPRNWFQKGTNTWNRYSLFDLIAITSLVPDFDFPDYSRLSISRIDPKTSRTEDIRIDVATALENGDCSVNRWLDWGDIIDVPVEDHLLNANWQGLSQNAYETLQKCLERTVHVSINRLQTNVVLRPLRSRNMSVSSPMNGWESRMELFRLSRWLRTSGLLLLSSDLSRVKVRRTDPVTKATEERVFNLINQQGDSNDLWLQNGDVIEVPNKL